VRKAPRPVMVTKRTNKARGVIRGPPNRFMNSFLTGFTLQERYQKACMVAFAAVLGTQSNQPVMRARAVKIVTKIWLATCLVVLALALVPVFQPSASLHSRYGVSSSHRLQRHSFMNVADGRRPKARLLKTASQPSSCLVLVLIRPSLNHSPGLESGAWLNSLSMFPHRRKFGRAQPGDPDHLV